MKNVCLHAVAILNKNKKVLNRGITYYTHICVHI